jgi:DNA-directed RNA polymerase specialized sigma24 family protein
MTTGTMSASGEYTRYIGQIYQGYNARLRGNFLALLGNASDADECVQETLRHFFYFMKDRCWESDVKSIDAYLMRIAGGVGSKKLAEKRAQREDSLGRHENDSLLDKVRREVFQPIQERVKFKQLFLRIVDNFRQPRLKQLSAALR